MSDGAGSEVMYVSVSIPQESSGAVSVQLDSADDRDADGNFRVGAVVTLSANPPAGQAFSSWSVAGGIDPDADATQSTLVFTVLDSFVDASVEAAFIEVVYPVCFWCESVGQDGAVRADVAGGTVVSADGSYGPVGGDTPEGWCAHGLVPGAKASFTAVAADWHDFVGWYGETAGVVSADPVSTEVTLEVAFPSDPDAGVAYVARFRERERSSFFADVYPTESGRRDERGGKVSMRLVPASGAASRPGGPALSDGPSFGVSVLSHVSPPEGTLVFEAYPDERHVFGAWQDLSSGTGWSSADRRARRTPDASWWSADPVFLLRPCRVRAVAAGSGTATVQAAGHGSPSGSQGCRLEDLATLRAVPAEGASFVGWADGGEGADLAERSVHVSGDSRYVAVFSDAPQVSVRPGSYGPGSVRGGRDAAYGEAVEVVPAPSSGAAFLGWTDGRADSPRTFRADGGPLPSAVFAPSPRGRALSFRRAMLA